MLQRSPLWHGKPKRLKRGLKLLFHSLHHTQQNFMINKAVSCQQLNTSSALLNLTIILKWSAQNCSPSNAQRKGLEGASCPTFLWLCLKKSIHPFVFMTGGGYSYLTRKRKLCPSWTHIQSLKGQLAHQLLFLIFLGITVFTVKPDRKVIYCCLPLESSAAAYGGLCLVYLLHQ